MSAHYQDLLATFGKYTVIDLSQTIEQDMPVWPTHPHFYQNEVETYRKGDEACLNQLIIGEHCGTHIDAPAHFIDGGAFMDQVPLEQCMGRGVKIDVSDLSACGLITVAMIEAWEAKHGPIIKGDIVMFYTGYERHWGVKPNYLPFLSDWPGLSPDGAEYLAAKDVKAVCSDAMALDAFGNAGNPTHHVLLSKGILIIENLANLQKIKDFCLFICQPLKIKHGSASPVRPIALV